jgi:metallo-beta-lactamase family protein
VIGSLFLAHGEPNSLKGLQQRLTAAGIDAGRIVIPALDQSFTLLKQRVEPVVAGPPRLTSEAATALDWHNARAAFLGDLDDALQAASGDAARAALLERLSNALAGGALQRERARNGAIRQSTG